MKNWIWIFAATLVVTCACDRKTVYTDDEGNQVTVSGDGKTVKVETGDGSAEMKVDDSGTFEMRDEKGNIVASGAGSVTEAQLGVPFYPESTEIVGSTSKTPSGGESVTSVRETKDSPEMVRAFYEAKLGLPAAPITDGVNYYGTWKVGARKVNVSISKADGRTTITIISVTGN